MSLKIFNRHNFYKQTYCVFQEVESNLIAFLKSDYTSKSGSTYYFTEEGVFRKSNHWGRAANCKWRLEALPDKSFKRCTVGFARWTDFLPDNEIDKLYAISINFENATAHYDHKLSREFPLETIYRTAPETMKRLKIVRHHLKDSNWLRYFEGDPTHIRQKILTEWNTSHASLDVIKRKYLQ